MTNYRDDSQRTLNAEDFLGVSDSFRSGRFDVFQYVVDTEFLVLGEGQGVVGEDFDFFNVVERVDEFARFDEQFVVVAHAGDEYVTNPDGFVDFVEVVEHVDDVLVVVTGEFFMLFGINVFDVDEQQVGALHESLELSKVRFVTNKVYARGVDAGVYACGFRGFKEFNEKIHLNKGLATAHGDAAVFAPVALVAQRLL